MKVLVAGAGPTGLTAALELARLGIDATVIDRRDEASGLSRAVGIMPGSLNLLSPSGVTEQLLAEGIKLQEVRLYDRTRPVLSLSLKGGHPDWDYGIALAQDRTEAVLRDALVRHGGSVTYGRALEGLRQEDTRVVAETSDGAEETYDYLIGADGARSRTRACLGLDFPGFDLPETWSIADLEVKNWPHPQAGTFSMLPAGRFAVVVPLERERFRVISNTEDALAALPLPIEVTKVRRAGTFTISIRQVPRYGVGRVFLAGDAAHCHSPAGGRGMNLGIADSAELAGRIAENRLVGYSDSRHQVGAQTIALSERMRKTVTPKSPIRRQVTLAAFGLVNLLPPLQRAMARQFLSG